MASRAREFPGESSCSVFARGSPGNLLDSGQEVTLVPLTPITAVTRYWPVMDIVPPPSEDQVPRLQAFRAEHPDIEIAGPAGSRTGMWPAYQGGTILAVTFGLRRLLDRLDELLASGWAVTTRKAPVPKWYSRVLWHAVEVH